MDPLQKCVYLADAIEPGRNYPGVEELRGLAANSLDDALRSLARLTIIDLVERRRPVHPATVALYNELHG
jgi:HD superfamily phosphohydrolase YqeK